MDDQEVISRLQAARSDALARVRSLTASHTGIVEASLDTNADDEHDPEGATIAFERSQVSALIRQAEARLAQIEQALERVAEGTYGRCTACGQAISPERLDVRPDALACIRCA